MAAIPGRSRTEDFQWNSRFRHLLVLFGDGAGRHGLPGAEEGRTGRRHPRPRPSTATATTRTSSTSPAAARRGGRSSRCEMIQAAETVPVMDGKAVFKLAVTRMPEVTVEVLSAAATPRGPGPPDHAPGQPAHQREGAADPGAAGRQGLQQHPEVRQHHLRHPAPRLPRGAPGGQAPEGALVAFTALGAGLHWGVVLMRV